MEHCKQGLPQVMDWLIDPLQLASLAPASSSNRSSTAAAVLFGHATSKQFLVDCLRLCSHLDSDLALSGQRKLALVLYDSLRANATPFERCRHTLRPRLLFRSTSVKPHVKLSSTTLVDGTEGTEETGETRETGKTVDSGLEMSSLRRVQSANRCFSRTT